MDRQTEKRPVTSLAPSKLKLHLLFNTAELSVFCFFDLCVFMYVHLCHLSSLSSHILFGEKICTYYELCRERRMHGLQFTQIRFLALWL